MYVAFMQSLMAQVVKVCLFASLGFEEQEQQKLNTKEMYLPFRLLILKSLINPSRKPSLWSLLVGAFWEANWPVLLVTEVPTFFVTVF